jgi:hypothetical protein
MSGAVDVAVRVGLLPGQNSTPLQPRIDLKMVNDWTDVQAFELFPDILCPVCSPNLLAGKSIETRKSKHFDLGWLVDPSTREPHLCWTGPHALAATELMRR